MAMHTRRRSWTRTRVLTAASVMAALAGCHSVTDPPGACFVEPPSGDTLSALGWVEGAGACDPAGAITATPFPNGGTFAVTIRVRLVGARPSTLYYVQRAAEFPQNATSADKVCQRAEGTWEGFTGDPWVTFPRPSTSQGPTKTLTTDAAGNAVLEFDYFSPAIPTGAKFDVMMRLVDADVGGEGGISSELRSVCMTIVPR
jgi:hypothetical protein